MPYQIKHFILIFLFNCCFYAYSQSEETEKNIAIKDSIENYLINASEAINTDKLANALQNISKAKELAIESQDIQYIAQTNRVLAELLSLIHI